MLFNVGIHSVGLPRKAGPVNLRNTFEPVAGA
jgi:hypothetical protein